MIVKQDKNRHLDALKAQLSSIVEESLKARRNNETELYELLQQLCRALTFCIQLKEGTLNTRNRIGKAWDEFSNVDKSLGVWSQIIPVYTIMRLNRRHYGPTIT